MAAFIRQSHVSAAQETPLVLRTSTRAAHGSVVSGIVSSPSRSYEGEVGGGSGVRASVAAATANEWLAAGARAWSDMAECDVCGAPGLRDHQHRGCGGYFAF